MPRAKRVWMPNCFYHVSCRGNRREPLFLNASDFRVFFYILEQLHDKIPYEIASYCLMTNHYHLQIRSQEIPFSKLMSLINKRYANYFNTKYSLTGHVFEKRYYGQVIEDRAGMISVSRYIHLNPVEANMVKEPESYPWSSYYLFTNPTVKPANFVNMNCLLDLFYGTVEQKREIFRACHAPNFVED